MYRNINIMSNNNKKDYLRCSLGLAAAQICQSLGWHSVHRSSHDILTDILERYLKQLSATAANYSQNYSRTIPNLDDVALAFDQLGIYLHELEDYVHQVEPVCPSSSLPEVPCHESGNHLLHEQDGQFPPPVDMKQEHQQVEKEIESEMEIVKEENVEVKENKPDMESSTSTQNKVNRPKELTLRTDSVESPPYSPLEPKSLNIDALVNSELTRPGLKVTTPKGYTPTLTTQSAVPGIASFTNTTSKIESLSSPAYTITTPSKDIANTHSKSKTKKEKKKNQQDKVKVKKEEKTILSPPKTNRNNLKSPPSKHKSNILSPKSAGSSHKTKSPKPKIPVAGITDFIKTNTVIPPSAKVASPPTVTDSRSAQSLNIKEENSGEVATPSKESSKIEIKREFLHSPPPLTLPPQILLSPTATKQEASVEIKQEEVDLPTPSRTVIFSNKSDVSPVSIKLEHSPPPLLTSDLLSPDKSGDVSFTKEIDENSSSVLVSPVPMDMPVLTFQKKVETPDADTSEIKSEHEIDILSVSQDELQPSLKFEPTLTHRSGEEKKKKKKKKSDRDDKNRKHEGKEKKEKRKKREEKESVTPIPKLTFKLGGATISESNSNLSFDATPSSTYSASPEPMDVLPTKSSKKHKSKHKEEKHKEPPLTISSVKSTSSIYVETLTNTSSALGGEVYYCPACGLPDDGSPMIGCDSCDLWYHWPCVNITVEPADDDKWFCPKCLNAPPAKKKKKKKKRES